MRFQGFFLSHVILAEMPCARSGWLCLRYSHQVFPSPELIHERLHYLLEFSHQPVAGQASYQTGKSHHGLYARRGTAASSYRSLASLRLPIKLFDYIGSHRTVMVSRTSASYCPRQTAREAIVQRLADGHPVYFKSLLGRCL